MPAGHSVSDWIASLKEGELDAATRLWERYRERLFELASRKMAGIPKRISDEDDVAQSVFSSFCRGLKAGRFDNVADRDDLWWLLITLTKQKAIDVIRRGAALKRGGHRVFSESSRNTHDDTSRGICLDDLIGEVPTPETLVILEEENRRLLDLLDDVDLARIAVWRLEGYTVDEIADKASSSRRSVERKLQCIRNAWSKELAHAE